ncbi:MAG: shikimate kinase [Defluviitaleaceae bacterium]|nr:shikimate kinase [Defluviitaleaceae bacterium]
MPIKISLKSRIALIGFMGAGKTSVSQALSQLNGIKFIDMDAEIEKTTQMPIPHIFDKYGEGHFRCLEHEFCQQIPFMDDVIIATGGGCILDSKNRDILRDNAWVVYLKASPATILARIGDDTSRPLLFGGDKLSKITALLAEREPLYLQTAHFTIETDGMDIITCAEQIIRARY